MKAGIHYLTVAAEILHAVWQLLYLACVLVCVGCLMAEPAPEPPDVPDTPVAPVEPVIEPEPPAPAPAPDPLAVLRTGRPKRLLLILGDDAESRRVRDVELASLRRGGWTVGDHECHVQVIHIGGDEHALLLQHLGVGGNAPVVKLLREGSVSASLSSPFNAWDLAGLYNGKKYEQPAGNRSKYPLRASLWSGCNSYEHMLSGQHAGKFDSQWVRSLSWDELQSLHSDDHEGRVNWNYARRYERPRADGVRSGRFVTPGAAAARMIPNIRQPQFCPT